jgi:hypothetical protein
VILGFVVRFQEPDAGLVLGSMLWCIMSFVAVHGDGRIAIGKFLEARMAFMTAKGSSNSIGESKLVRKSGVSDLTNAGVAAAAAAEDCKDSKDSSRGLRGPDAAAAAEDCTDSSGGVRGPDAAAAAEDCTDNTDSSGCLRCPSATNVNTCTMPAGGATFGVSQMRTELMGTEAGTSRPH